MKKLLSICFLSILLGLLSFSTQAQNCSGFWIENLQPQTLTGVANAPGGEGVLVLDNVMKEVKPGDGIGRTDLYELHFCPCGLDPKTQVSVDWLLYRDGELVNGNLSDYADFEIYTLNPELNVQGQCQSIGWLGGKVQNVNGFCDEQVAEQNALLALQNQINGIGPCNNAPTNYPGALQTGYGTPGAALIDAITGTTSPALGLTALYSQGFDYFYMDFFSQTRTIVKITWKQIGTYSLVMRVRQRFGGDDWTNAFWKRDEAGNLSQVDYIGGHGSCCGPILAQDSIHYLVTGDFSKEVCENDNYNFGTIDYVNCEGTNTTYQFTSTVEDTLVLFGTYTRDHCCDHLVVDSIYSFHFYQRNTPEAVVPEDTTFLCQCDELNYNTLLGLIDYDPVDLDKTSDHYFQWRNADAEVFDAENHFEAAGVPDYNYYKNSYTQQIYSKEEVLPGSITGLKLYVVSNPEPRKLQIFLSPTDKDVFASKSDWDHTYTKVKVFEGEVDFQEGWNDIDFNVEANIPFVYDGNKNMLVTVVDYTGTWTNDVLTYYASEASSKSLLAYSDYTQYGAIYTGAADYLLDYRNDMVFKKDVWEDTPVILSTDVAAADYEFTVRQVNVYSNFNVLDGSKKDTITCIGDPQTFVVTVKPMLVNLSEDAEFCVADFTGETELTVIATHEGYHGQADECATTTRWFAAGEDGADLSEVIFEGDTFVIDSVLLSAYFDFAANQSGKVVFYAAGYNANNGGCLGKILTPYTITFNQTPVLAASVTPESMVCPGSEVAMQVSIVNNPSQVIPKYNYYWLGVDSAEAATKEELVTLEIADNTQTGKSRTYLPDYSFYNYSYSQQIYTAAEVGSAGTISGISFDLTANPQSRDIEIYLSSIDKDHFEITDYDYYGDLSDDWDLNSKTLVYSGTVPFDYGWNDIQFDTPFEYDGRSNLLVTFVDVTGSYSSYYMYFNTSSTSDYMAVCIYDDYTLISDNILDGVEGRMRDYRNDVHFTMKTFVDGMVPFVAPTIDTVRKLVGNSHTESSLIPYNTVYKNTYSQQIFTADEIQLTGTISALQLNFAGQSGISDNTNFEVYLAPTTKTSFANTTDWEVSEDMVLVYQGVPAFKNGWNELPFTTSFNYDGESNLMVTIIVNNSVWSGHSNQVFYQFPSPSNTAMYIRDDNTVYNNDNITDYSANSRLNTRNEIAFKFSSPIVPGYCAFESNSKSNNAIKNVVPTCNAAYEPLVYVVDGNGCKSNEVAFNFVTGDTLKPSITPAVATLTFNTCDSAELAEFAEDYAFTSDEELDIFLKGLFDQNTTNPNGVYDNCSLLKVTYSDEYAPMGDNCEIQIVRTFTVTDSCGNDSTFVLTIIGHDDDAPIFTADRPMRLIPVAAGDCKYDAPSLETMKNTIRPYLYDACTDVDYLLDSIKFFWENTDINPAGAHDIFVEKNHLTIRAKMRDLCGNWCEPFEAFFLDRPEDMYIVEDEIQPQVLCFGDTATVTFDPASIVDDIIAGPYVPYTYQWSEVNGEPVIFTDETALTTKVIFPEGNKTYKIVMIVTNSNECDTVSAVREFYVRPQLQVSIEPEVHNGATEPYCPNYGNLTVNAVVNGVYDYIKSYEWIGESVNIYSTTEQSYVKIVPEWCDTLYEVTVNVMDDHNCPATGVRTFRASANGPIFLSQLPNDTVEISAGCATLVPDYKDAITRDMIIDSCYTFSEITANDDWYTQDPAPDYEFTTPTQNVTITVKNPCGKTSSISFLVVRPNTLPTVTINPADDMCFETYMEEGAEFTITTENVGDNPTFEWTIDDEVVGTDATLSLNSDIWLPENEEIQHTVEILVTNTDNDCDVTANVPFTIHYQGDPVYTRVWNNTMCGDHFNGMVAVDTIYTDYVVTLEGVNVPYPINVKVNDVPHHDATPWNTVYFDSLRAGTYHVTVTNNFNCVMEDDVVVGNSGIEILAPIYDSVNQTECIANGSITITSNDAYQYELYRVNYSGIYELVEGNLSYTGLASGRYAIRAIDLATTCDDYFPVYLDDESVPEVISADSTNVTDCQTPNGTITVNSDVDGMLYRIAKNNTSYYSPVYYPTSGTLSENVEGLYVNSGYPTQHYYYQSSNVFEGLSKGEYTVIAFNPQTGCYGFDVVTINDSTKSPVYEYVTTPNHYCSGNVYDGSITVTPATGYTYTLKKSQGGFQPSEVITASEPGKFTGLQHYDRNMGRVYYQLTVTDPTTHCTADPVSIHLEKDFYMPDTSAISTNPNSVCDAELATMTYDGSVTFNVTATGNNVSEDGSAASCEYTVVLHDRYSYGDDWNSSSYYTTGNLGYIEISQNDEVVAHLTLQYGETYSSTIVPLISGVEAEFRYYNGNSYPTWRLFEIYDQDGEIVWQKGRDDMETYNQSHYHYVTPSCATGTSITPEQAFNQYIKDYTIKIDGVNNDYTATNTFSNATATFAGLDDGMYSAKITSAYNCSVTRYFEIEEAELQPLTAIPSPDHFCERTFEKPGDGKIKILTPTDSSNPGHFYTYSFKNIAEEQMIVPYLEPLTHTAYWLAHNTYEVTAFEPATGCTVTANITVDWDPYTVDFDYNTTPNYACNTIDGNGSITVINPTSTNPDAVFAYSIDGGEYTLDPVFTGLHDGEYVISVIDTTKACHAEKIVPVNPTDSCAPVIEICDNLGTCGDEYHYCIGSDGIILTATATDTCNNASFTYKWSAPCSTPGSSNTASIAVQTDHAVTNGCEYRLTVTNNATGCEYVRIVNVYVHPNPDLYATINGSPAKITSPNWFCENDELVIAVYNNPDYSESLDVESIVWSQAKDATGVQQITISGTEFKNNDNITVCVRANNEYGCPSPILSIPVSFKREIHKNVVDTVCGDEYAIAGTELFISMPEQATYPYTKTEEISFQRTAPLCDSIVSYQITFIAAPTFSHEDFMPDLFCEDEHKTLAEFTSYLTDWLNWNGAEGTTAWMSGQTVLSDDQDITYDFVTNNNVKFVATNRCNSTEIPVYFRVVKKPVIVDFTLNDTYCASQEYTFTATVSSYNNTAKAVLYLQGHEDQPLGETTFNGLNQTIEFPGIKTPWSYDEQSLELKVFDRGEYCDPDYAAAILNVDTAFIEGLANNKVYCVGQEIKLSDFTGISADSYNSVALMHMTGNAPSADDEELNLPFELNNRDLNGEYVYFIASNDCYNDIISNRVTLTVNDKPEIEPISNIDVCAEDFVLNAPDVEDNGSDILEGQGHHHWWIMGESGYYSTSILAIKEAAADNQVQAAYIAENGCGADTAEFTVLVNNLPKVTFNVDPTMCPNAVINSEFTPDNTNVNFHNINGVAGVDNIDYFVAKTNGVRVVVDVETLTFADIASYDELWYVAENPCGADSASIAIDVLTNYHGDFTVVDTCKGNKLGDFIVGGQNPSWTGSATLNESECGWLIKATENSEPESATLETVIEDNVLVAYKWVTTCEDEEYTDYKPIFVKVVPTVDIDADNLEDGVITVCEGSTISFSELISTPDHSATVISTTWELDGVQIDDTHVFSMEDNEKDLVVTIVTTCGDATNSVTVNVKENPKPEITVQNRVCSGSEVTFTATAGYDSYVFTIDGVAQDPQTSNEFTTEAIDNNPDDVTIITASVTVTDEFGCSGSSASPAKVSVTDQVAFTFYNADGGVNEEHVYNVSDGGGLDFGWEIDQECNTHDTLVYVEFDIYYEGRLLSNDSIGEFFSTVTNLDVYQQIHQYISTISMSWFSGNNTPRSTTATYNFAVADSTVSAQGNHFPNTDLDLGNNNVYDDLWLHFIGGRAVDHTFVPFRKNGTYTVEFRLFSTSNANDFNDYYTEHNQDHDNYGSNEQHIGGQNALVTPQGIHVTRKLLAVDHITINVSNVPEVQEPETVVIPETAPMITMDENVVAPEMEVWPNPAPAITTTFKARVHNMNGEANVSITSLTGKQIYNGKINIDNDSYYFEASVNNLSVGTYMMTVRTADAVITKKVIVTR